MAAASRLARRSPAWPEVASALEAESTAMAWKSRCSMVDAVVRYSRSEAEVSATVVSMVNQGHAPVRHLQGSRFDLGAFSAD
jgi:hypothetical protein